MCEQFGFIEVVINSVTGAATALKRILSSRQTVSEKSITSCIMEEEIIKTQQLRQTRNLSLKMMQLKTM